MRARRKPVAAFAAGDGRRRGLERAAREIEQMWTALVEWADEVPPPPAHWRTDIALMANERVRRLAWLIERDKDAAAFWSIFTQHMATALEGARPRD